MLAPHMEPNTSHGQGLYDKQMTAKNARNRRRGVGETVPDMFKARLVQGLTEGYEKIKLFA